MKIEELNQDYFKSFVNGDIPETNFQGFSYALVFLEIIDHGLFCVAGSLGLHSTILSELPGHWSVGSVGCAARLTSIPDVEQIILKPGGSSLTGYTIRRVGDMERKFNGWLEDSNDPRRITIRRES